jgi:uncharacterized protein YutE (UPF0331/DUF86 family)
MDDIVLNKIAIMENCTRRVHEEYAGDDKNLFEDFTKQDSIILNIQRACEAAIDLAMHIIRKEKLGIPQDCREAFTLLQTAGLLEPALAERLIAMVGFRNVAVHDYKKLNLEIVKKIIADYLEDLPVFGKIALNKY